MEVYIRLPKDLQYIVNDYLKDRTNYDLVVQQFEKLTYLGERIWFICLFDDKVKFNFFWLSDKLKKEHDNSHNGIIQ